MQALFHTSDEEVGKRYMGAEGGMRDWLEERRGVLLPEYFTTEVWIFEFLGMAQLTCSRSKNTTASSFRQRMEGMVQLSTGIWPSCTISMLKTTKVYFPFHILFHITKFQ